MSDERFKSIMRERLEAEGYHLMYRVPPDLECTCRGEAHDECKPDDEE